MKTAKKLGTLLLAVLMILALAAPAFAADATNTLTITGAPENHTFNAYQIFKGKYNATSGKLEDIDWGTGFNTTSVDDLVSALKTKFTGDDYADIQALPATGATPAAIAAAIGKITDVEDAKALATIFAQYTSSTATPSTYANETYTISGLTDGYYIVKDSSANSDANDVISDFIMKIVKSESVAIKGDIPEVDKKVKTPHADDYEDGDAANPADVQIGDILDYEIIGTLPTNYADYTAYKMVFTDTLSGNIALKTDADTYGVYVVNGATETKVASGYTPNVTATGLTVTIDNTKLLKDASENTISTTKDSTIVVKYQAEVLSSTVPGTADKNSATITYSKDPHSTATGTTEPDIVNTVTQSFKFIKYDGSTNKLLAGATFKIMQGEDLVKLVKISEIEYKVADSDDANQVDTFTTVSTSDAITIKGLAEGVTYTLVETAAPAGYNELQDGKTFSVTTDTTAETAPITAGVFDPDADAAVVAVANNSGTVLPATGGTGTVIFIAIGAIAVMAAGVVLTAKKRLYNEG